ncbi:hypothetical protein J6590_102190 [Homalodisca vitripennis]|nr:hypothetical protein J6590_102190 [Homalodisca vitripennis]
MKDWKFPDTVSCHMQDTTSVKELSEAASSKILRVLGVTSSQGLGTTRTRIHQMVQSSSSFQSRAPSDRKLSGAWCSIFQHFLRRLQMPEVGHSQPMSSFIVWGSWIDLGVVWNMSEAWSVSFRVSVIHTREAFRWLSDCML